ncbi:hypothetical protein MJ257_07565 [Paenibacillus timonensis]|uniref:Uncharacterized protein n=2 Tax=Paenibacillus timonensis TaxID=225915 RepID=A0ABW3SAS0_9BACL|nr:hypothetical protein [Paenibacillus timonensis]MCH1639957.1 hypothetical protein [Paenibacillus timonensis]
MSGAYMLYHYFEKDLGPFRNLSSLPVERALEVSEQIRQEGKSFASRRSAEYMLIRKELEQTARERFIVKGGQPQNAYPHYMTLESCDWLKTWYTRPDWIRINWDEFQETSISFTYGDLFPTMRYQEDKPYRRQVYTKREIVEVIAEYGLPQVWNRLGDHGPERYIEVQIWDDEVLRRFMPND